MFDSGVGGLTVVASLRSRLPALDLVYLGDTARLPYGTKSAATVARYTHRNISFLLDRGVDGIVVACNSASAMALDTLAVSVPVWGVIEPGAAAAAACSVSRVGVIATEATVRSQAYPRALHRLRPELDVRAQPCPLLVPLVEEGWLDDEVTDRVLRRYLEPLLLWGMDTLVLGCTHYPLLEPAVRRVVGPAVTLVDSAAAVSARVAEDLATSGAEVTGSAGGRLELLVTDDSPAFARLAERILDESVRLHWVDTVPATAALMESLS
ncbi:MAG TPA: glutamate racemase [Thermoanaerobaculia bacterium]|nr:glutamate racemase [Thermoanaerobaculia bacterium]